MGRSMNHGEMRGMNEVDETGFPGRRALIDAHGSLPRPAAARLTGRQRHGVGPAAIA